MPRFLEGVIDVAADERDETIARLERELRTARRDLETAQTDAQRAREDANRALSMLRGQLSPLYRALQAVFGELDAAGVTDSPADAVARAPGGPAAAPGGGETGAHVGGRSAREMALWADWKAKLSPACGKVIDALLLHSDLSVKQLRSIAHLGENSVYQATSKLGQLGLVTKSGGRFALRALE